MTRTLALMSAVTLATLLPTSAAAQGAPAFGQSRCATADYHLMDYMLGDWDVVDTNTGDHFLFNKVVSIDDGCAIRENLVMQKNVPGTSITFFSGEDARWYSYYHAPHVHAVLEGTTSPAGVSDLVTTMVLPGKREPQQVRQLTDRDATGRPHQTGYVKAAAGKWKKMWDLTFCARPRDSKAAPPCGGTSMATRAQDLATAGVEIPRTSLAVKAQSYVRSVEPDFLFNHSVRTYLFGAMRLKARNITYDPETAYVAALFHDLGLVRGMASPNASFEIDGANKAEQFVMANGGSADQARVIWNAIVTHDMGGIYQKHQSPEALLLGIGAGSDVDGVDPKAISPDIVAKVLAAYPRLRFKRQFTAAAVDHCRRKPTSQIGWLDPLCRKAVPDVDRGDVENEIGSAPFAE